MTFLKLLSVSNYVRSTHAFIAFVSTRLHCLWCTVELMPTICQWQATRAILIQPYNRRIYTRTANRLVALSVYKQAVIVKWANCRLFTPSTILFLVILHYVLRRLLPYFPSMSKVAGDDSEKDVLSRLLTSESGPADSWLSPSLSHFKTRNDTPASLITDHFPKSSSDQWKHKKKVNKLMSGRNLMQRAFRNYCGRKYTQTTVGCLLKAKTTGPSDIPPSSVRLFSLTEISWWHNMSIITIRVISQAWSGCFGNFTKRSQHSTCMAPVLGFIQIQDKNHTFVSIFLLSRKISLSTAGENGSC